MLKEEKNLESLVNEVDVCNSYFTNHVGIHMEERFRRGVIILQVIAVMLILFM